MKKKSEKFLLFQVTLDQFAKVEAGGGLLLNHSAAIGLFGGGVGAGGAMQAELKTIPAAAAFIPLTGTHTHLTAPYIRPNYNQPKYQNANSYYNR